jgi:hypothetical protein
MDKTIADPETPPPLPPKPMAEPVDWEALYERTAAKFPKTLKRLGE